MSHDEFEKFDSMVWSSEKKVRLRDDYIRFLEEKAKRLEKRMAELEADSVLFKPLEVTK